MIANDALGLPGGERSERPQFGDGGFDHASAAISHHARRFSHRETVEMILAHIEREPLPSGGLDHQDRLAGANVLADLCGDDGDDTVSRSTQGHLVKTALEHGDRGGGGLHLRVGDRAFLPGRPRRGSIEVVLMFLALRAGMFCQHQSVQAMRAAAQGSGGVRRRWLPCPFVVYWRAASPLGHATIVAAPRWRRAHRGPQPSTSSCRYRCRSVRSRCWMHGALLVFGVPCQLRWLAGAGSPPEHPVLMSPIKYTAHGFLSPRGLILKFLNRAEDKAGPEDAGEQAPMRGLDTAFLEQSVETISCRPYFIAKRQMTWPQVLPGAFGSPPPWRETPRDIGLRRNAADGNCPVHPSNPRRGVRSGLACNSTGHY